MTEMKDKYEKRAQFLEKELEYVKSELQSTRRILHERDELLLHLQWDEDDRALDHEGQKKKKKSKEKVLTEERQMINRLRAQMKLMENALEERDLNIASLKKELNDTRFTYQQQIENMRTPREAPQRTKTSWGFRSSPSSSPLNLKPSPNSSPALMQQSGLGMSSGSGSPANSPMTPMPNYAATTFDSPSTASPAMDSQEFNKKMQKKPSFFTFKKTSRKPTQAHIQETNWAEAH
eukprot:gene17955-21427_t